MTLVQKVKNGIKWFTPYGIIIKRGQKFKKIQTEIKDYFLNLNTDDPEIIEIIDFIKKHGVSIFPYEFSRKYHASDIDVFFDNTTKMRYVIHENKKLYFPEDWNDENIQIHYNGMRMDQDENSPHRYEADGFVVREGDIIADVGAAEGIWALSNVEKAGKIYLFECDQGWKKALQKTFEPWKEKVIMVDKYVSNIDDHKNVTLDCFFDKNPIDFIKADIEGMELKLLEGSKGILSNNDRIKLLLCAYHSEKDGTEIKEILEKNGFKTEYSKRYMLFIFDKRLKKPYIRRCLVRAMKSGAQKREP